MKLYHYTTLESLALILKNQTIKFNRLDCVDDVEEGNAESAGVNLSKYMFVSCCSENSEDSIPLWKMYAGDGFAQLTNRSGLREILRLLLIFVRRTCIGLDLR